MFSIRYLDDLAPFILIILCVASARFLSPVLTLGVFIFTFAIYTLLKYDSRIFVGTALFLLVLCAVLLAKGSESFANEVAIWVYYFLVIGAIGLSIEHLREKKHES